MLSDASYLVDTYLYLVRGIPSENSASGLGNVSTSLETEWREAVVAVGMLAVRVGILSDDSYAIRMCYSAAQNVAFSEIAVPTMLYAPLHLIDIAKISESLVPALGAIYWSQGLPRDTPPPADPDFRSRTLAAARRFVDRFRAILNDAPGLQAQGLSAFVHFADEELLSFAATHTALVMQGRPENRMVHLHALREILEARPGVPRGVAEPLLSLGERDLSSQEWPLAQSICVLLRAQASC